VWNCTVKLHGLRRVVGRFRLFFFAPLFTLSSRNTFQRGFILFSVTSPHPVYFYLARVMVTTVSSAWLLPHTQLFTALVWSFHQWLMWVGKWADSFCHFGGVVIIEHLLKLGSCWFVIGSSYLMTSLWENAEIDGDALQSKKKCRLFGVTLLVKDCNEGLTVHSYIFCLFITIGISLRVLTVYGILENYVWCLQILLMRAVFRWSFVEWVSRYIWCCCCTVLLTLDIFSCLIVLKVP